MHVGSEAELLALSALRQLHRIEGLKAASEGGLLWFCTLTDWISPDSHLHGEVQCPAWFLTDAARVTALARRLDGRPWNRIGGKKAWLLPGSRGVWPIGISEVGCRDTISIVEGGPDFLALHCWLHMTRDSGSAPVALASCNPIAAEALPHFKGKQVQLFCHNDGAVGDKARITWTSQLVGAGAAAVTNFWFCNYFDVRRGKAPKDLNDFFTGLMAGMIYPASGAAGRAQQHQAAA
jgi:hypothetical protein